MKPPKNVEFMNKMPSSKRKHVLKNQFKKLSLNHEYFEEYDV